VGFVDHLRLSVRDVAASRAFYDPWLRVLSFAPVGRDDDGAAWGKRGPEGRMNGVVVASAENPSRSKIGRLVSIASTCR